MHCYFLLNVKHGALQLYLGGGASNYLAPALNKIARNGIGRNGAEPAAANQVNLLHLPICCLPICWTLVWFGSTGSVRLEIYIFFCLPTFSISFSHLPSLHTLKVKTTLIYFAFPSFFHFPYFLIFTDSSLAPYARLNCQLSVSYQAHVKFLHRIGP